MKRIPQLLTIIILFLGSVFLGAQDVVTISGYLTDSENGETLLFANVYIDGTAIGSNTNEYGFYSLDIPKGEPVTVIFSYVGFQSIEEEVNVTTATTVNIKLAKVNFLTEVEVVAQRKGNEQETIRSTQTSAATIPIDQIRTIPSLGGEVDIIKVAQLMPGVSKGGEGGTSMFVRGGDADQNLVLLDEATVYNIGHLFGFFSVFNPDALKDMTIIKGGFPAHYGGRLSSVLDVRMKDGNNQKFAASGGIGLLSSRLTLEAPILKDKASILLSGRRTYIDKVFKAVKQPLPYYFYDLNAKFNYRISDKDRIFVSAYFGDDVLDIKPTDIKDDDDSDDDETNFDLNFGFKLGNFTQTLRWNHIYTPKLFSNLSFIHTAFNYDISGKVGDNSVLIKSEIRDLGVKLDFANFISDKSKLRFGGQVISHDFRPNILSAKGEISDVVKNKPGQKLNTLEVALYANYEYLPSDKLSINAGLRLSGAAVKDKFYAAPEPRISARYLLNDRQSIKLSYSRMNQYMHRVSSSTVALPTDLWYPISAKVKPQSSHQIAASFNHLFEDAGITLTMEGYYKTMKNLIEYKEGSTLILNDNFEDLLLQGTGKSWGSELLIRKQTGKLNGWIGYTLAWSRRSFDELNEGKDFWAKYDRRHQLSIVANYDISKRLTFSAVWEYSTGARFTPLRANYIFPNAALTGIEFIPVYSKRNEFKMSSSHRLDVNLVIRNKRTKRFDSEWHIGGYNVYNRATPYSIRVKLDESTGALKYEQPGLFGFIPSIAYNFKF